MFVTKKTRKFLHNLFFEKKIPLLIEKTLKCLFLKINKRIPYLFASEEISQIFCENFKKHHQPLVAKKDLLMVKTWKTET
ncbi:hypothetical protein BpHYR1_050457 [Brachionus plicatilis]|uniref:Uncharacterized protein n=1 Tax=Brachionus plicatilis TaxID=10195 RepID=A0A3M7QAC6_BRAPC|nr:hypothetical protein BpHYR1_050457 [Brachionus plicatilis]